MENIQYANSNQKRTVVAVLMSGKIDFKTFFFFFARDKAGFLRKMMKGLIHDNNKHICI